MDELATRTAAHPGSVALMRAHQAANAAMLDMLNEVGRLESDEVNFQVAAGDMAEWLACDLGIARKTATSWVRVARKLPDLPLTAAAYREVRSHSMS